MRVRTTWGLCLTLLFGCQNNRAPIDPVGADAGARDAETAKDAGFGDAAVADAQGGDGAVPDAGVELEDAAVPDAGTPDAGADCIFGAPEPAPRLDPRRGMPAERLDRLTECLLDRPADADVLIDAFLAEYRGYGGGAPYSAAGEALLFFRGDATGLTVSGSFDGWPEPGIRTFSSVAGTDLHVARIPIGRGERHQYKLTRSGGGVEWSTDPLNPWVVWDGFDQMGVGSFNNEIIGPDHILSTSVIHRFFVRDRDVFLQLPLAHFMSPPSPLGVLYVSDGNEMLTRAGMQAVVDQTIGAGRASPVAVAWVALPSQDVRRDEYTYGTPTANGDAYVAMLADEIAPVVEAGLTLAPMPENRGVGGASLGGLISFHAAWSRPDVFRLVGAQSASLFWNDEEMIDRVDLSPVLPIRVYLDSGSPNDNMTVNQLMADVLQAKGYDYLHVIEPGAAHDWAFWAGRFDELLEFLYP